MTQGFIWPIGLKELWPAIRGSSEPFVYMPISCPVAVLHTHTIIKLLTLLCLSRLDKAPLFESRDYRRCSGQLCHTKFTCLVFIVWPLLSHSSPHTWWCNSAVHDKSSGVQLRLLHPLTVLSELPSQNYTPLPCNSPNYQIAKICFAPHYQTTKTF